MRKSTLWITGLFIMCMLVFGWKMLPESMDIQETFLQWKNELGVKSLKAFLKWRSPEVAVANEHEEDNRLLEAEQQAYVLLQENEAWKTGTEFSGNEQVADAQNQIQQSSQTSTDNQGQQSGQSGADDQTQQSNQNGTNGQENQQTNLSEKTEPLSENQKTGNQESADSASFSEYVQAATNNQLKYNWNQLTDFDFIIDNFYQVHSSTTIYESQLDVEECLKMDLTIDTDTEGPQILIYHTHGSEYFKDSDTGNPDTLITGVGDVLQEILEEKYGYKVYHDKTVFPYNSSYSEGRKLVKNLLAKYPDIQVVIDLHRDSSPNTHLVTEVNGKQTAQIMFFNGMSQTKSGPLTSRSNENLSTNLAFSLQMKLAAEQLYPGFTRKNYLKAYRYNMDLAGRYALIEVGAETNTIEEEKNAMEPLAEILHCVLQ